MSKTKLVLHYITLVRHFETTGQLTIESQMKHSLMVVFILKISRDWSLFPNIVWAGSRGHELGGDFSYLWASPSLQSQLLIMVFVECHKHLV